MTYTDSNIEMQVVDMPTQHAKNNTIFEKLILNDNKEITLKTFADNDSNMKNALIQLNENVQTNANGMFSISILTIT